MDLQLENNIEQLVQECRQGDHDAFHKLYNCLHKPIFGFIITRTNNREDAKDILQDVFIDLWRALENFFYRSDKQFYGFVFTIVKRKLAKYYNSHKKTVSLTEGVIHEIFEHVPAFDARLFRAIQKLTPKYREVLELRYWSDLTFVDIANFLKIKETTVKVRHHRALKKLSKLYAE